MKNIAIIAGGFSSEKEVSLRSAEGIHSFMHKDRYHCYTVLIEQNSWVAHYNNEILPIDKNDFSFIYQGNKIKTDFAYITIHGTPGENGLLQGYFDLIGIPYSTGNVLVEALTFNKYTLNNFLRSFNVHVSDSICIRANEKRPSNETIIQQLGLPCFVKPNAGGSSFGVTKVKNEQDLNEAISKALKESNEVMIEKLMEGIEITCGCYKTKEKQVVFPITEIITTQEFFDYDAKYNGKVTEITPARLTQETTKQVQELTATIYDLIGAKGIIRIDYMLKGEKGLETIQLIEINTTPGMTKTSFIPQQVKAAGIDIKDVMADIIEDAFK